jgi:hypothetical protein
MRWRAQLLTCLIASLERQLEDLRSEHAKCSQLDGLCPSATTTYVRYPRTAAGVLTIVSGLLKCAQRCRDQTWMHERTHFRMYERTHFWVSNQAHFWVPNRAHFRVHQRAQFRMPHRDQGARTLCR